MSKIEGDDILGKSASDVWIAYTENVKKGNEAMKEILKTALEFQALSKNFGSTKNETDFTTAKEKQTKAIEAGSTALKKEETARLKTLELQIRIEKKFDSFNKKEEVARKKRETQINKESAFRQRLLVQKNKEAKASEKETEQLKKASSAWSRLNREFQRSKKNYQNILTSTKATTKEVRRAGIEFEAYRKKINLVDKAVGGYNSRLTNSNKLLKNFLSGIGLTVGITAFVSIMRNASKLIADFEQTLVGVGKTANLSGQELTDFGEDAIQIVTTRLQGINLNKLLELSEVAGQLGIRGSSNILKFSETLARLEVSTNLIGEEGARSIARILNVTEESVDTVDRLGSSIVELGNNFATTESEIVSSSTEIAKGIAIYGASSKEIVALGAVTSSLGIKSEVAGSSIQKAYIKIQEAISEGGKELTNFSKITGLSNEALSNLFKENSTEVFRLFIEGLGKIDEAGGDVNSTLKSLELSDIRLLKTITPLVSRYDELNRALEASNTAYKDNTALLIESDEAMDTLKGSTTELSNVWSGLVLEIERGDGVISNFFKNAVTGASNFLRSLKEVNQVSSKLTSKKKGILDFLGLGVFSNAASTGRAVALDQFFDVASLRDNTIKDIEDARQEIELELEKVSNISRKNFFTGFSTDDLNSQDIFKSKLTEINSILGKRKELRESLAVEASKLLVATDKELDFEETRVEARERTISDLQRIIKLLKDRSKEEGKAIVEEFKTAKSKGDGGKDKARKLAEQLKKDELELQKFILEQQKLALKEQLEEEERSAVGKLDIAKDLALKKQEIADVQLEKNLVGVTEGTDKEKLIQEKHKADLLKIESEFEDDKLKIVKDNGSVLQSRIKQELNVAKIGQNEELTTLKKALREKGALEEESEVAITNLKRKHARENAQIVIDSYKQILESSSVTGEARLAIQVKLSEATKLLEENKSDFTIEREKLTADIILQIANDLASALDDLAFAIFDGKILRIEEEIQANNDKHTALTERAGQDEVLKSKLEIARQKKEKKLEDEKRKQQIKQFKFEKVIAVNKAGIGVALAIINAAQTQPYIPLGLAATIAAGVLGSIQIASILATPIPKFKEGTKRPLLKDTLAIFGDGGKHEPVTKDGKLIDVSPKTSTLTVLPKGAEVHKSWDALASKMSDRQLESILKKASFNASLKIGGQEMTKMNATNIVNIEMGREFEGMRHDLRRELRDGFSRMKINVNMNNDSNLDYFKHRYFND